MAKSMKYIDSEASALFVISLGTSGSVMVKCAANPCGALFSAFVYGQIRLFKAPAVRVIAANTNEYKEIKFALDKMSISDKDLAIKVRDSLKRPFLLVMEYIPGFNLDTVEDDRALTIFHPDVIKGFVPDKVAFPPPKVEGNSHAGNLEFKESPLVTLGKILGSDIIMNNSDRAPTVWLNTGNSSNIFLEVEMAGGILNKDELLFDSKSMKDINVLNMVAIDNQTNPIDPDGAR
jgi:outer membrane lipoprotein-sorting protein